MENNLKMAQLERDLTDVEVNKINLQSQSVARIAEANAQLTAQEGQTQSKLVVEKANYEGFTSLYAACSITDQKHKASFDYLRTMSTRLAASNSKLHVTYLENNAVTAVSASG